ncbi:ABC transporter permease [Bacteroidota bacterium]
MLQSYLSGNRWLIYPGGIILGLILFGPLIALLAETIVLQIHDPGEGLSLILPTGRCATLFLRTIGLGLSVSLTGMVAGVMIASVLWRWNRGKVRQLRWLILVFAAIPPYIHALAWTSLISPVAMNGWWASWWVQLMSFLPIAAGLALVGLESVNRRLFNAARVIRSDTDTFRKIILPSAMPAILTGGALLFLLSISDYSVPSLFRVNVYALEIFSEFSSTGRPANAFLLSFPVIFCVLVVFIALYGKLNQILFHSKGNSRDRLNSFCWPPWFRLLQVLAFLILILQLMVPLVSLVSDISSLDHLQNSISSVYGEILYSLMVAAVSALASLPLAWLGIKCLSTVTSLKLWWLILFIPMIIPPALTGIGLISIWNHRFLPDIYNSWIILVLGDLSRFLPVALLVLFITFKKINPALIDAARIVERRSFRIIYRITLPLLAPGLIASAFVVFILSLGELGASILVAPPGKSTISMMIFNYLHYGESSTVAGLSLLLVIATLCAGVITYVILIRYRSFNKELIN